MPPKTVDDILELIKNTEEIPIIPTLKNRETIYRLGITVEDQEDLIHE